MMVRLFLSLEWQSNRSDMVCDCVFWRGVGVNQTMPLFNHFQDVSYTKFNNFELDTGMHTEYTASTVVLCYFWN